VQSTRDGKSIYAGRSEVAGYQYRTFFWPEAGQMVHFGAAGESFPVANLTEKPLKCHAEVGLYLGGAKCHRQQPALGLYSSQDQQCDVFQSKHVAVRPAQTKLPAPLPQAALSEKRTRRFWQAVIQQQLAVSAASKGCFS